MMKALPHQLAPAPAVVLAASLFLVGAVASASTQPSESPGAAAPREDTFPGYLQTLVVTRAESWIQRQVREFRTFRHLDRAYRLMGQNRLPEARIELEKYLAIDPVDLKVWATMMILRHRTGDMPGVIEAADTILRRQPAFVPALLYRGLAEQAQGAMDKAVESFEAAAGIPGIQTSDRRFSLNMLADAHLRQKAFDKAAAVLEALGELEHDASVYLRQGIAFEALQRLPEAQAAFSRAAAATPARPADRALALSMLADVAIRRHRYEDALAPARELARADSGFGARFRLGTVLENTRRLSEAAEAYREAVAAAPDAGSRVRAYRAVGEVGRKRGLWREAYDAILSAHKLRPDDPELFAELGRVCQAWGRNQEAIHWVRRALEARPSRADRELLATLCFAIGDYGGAAAEWTELLRDSRDLEERRRLLVNQANAFTAQGDSTSASHALRQAEAIRSDAATLDALAQSLQHEGRYNEAIESYRAVLSLQPSPLRHLQLGTLLGRIGKPDEALEHFGKALAGFSTVAERAPILEQQGFLHYQAGRYSEARIAFEAALALRGSDAELQAALGHTCLKLGAYEDAVSYLTRAAAVDETSSRLLALAQAQAAAGMPERAIASYRRALRSLPPGSPAAQQVRTSLGNLMAVLGRHEEAAVLFLETFERGGANSWSALAQAAESYGLAGNWPAAADTNRRLLELGGIPAVDRGVAAERLGHACARMDQPDLAVAAFRRALESGRDSPGLRESLGYALVRSGDKAGAIRQLEKALAGNRAPRLLVDIASLYGEVGRPGIAIYYLEEAARSAGALDRESLRVLWTSLGQFYASQDDHDRALSAWQRAQSIEARPATELGLARMERLLGRNPEARARLDTIDPSRLAPTEQAQLWDEFAGLYRSGEDFDKAISALEKANRIETRADRYYRIGLNQVDLGRRQEAIEAFEEAVAREPQNTRYAEALGYAYRRAGLVEKAAGILESVVRADPDYLRVYEDLGYIEMERGRNNQADRWFRQAIDNSPLRPTPSPEAEKALRLDVFRMRGEVSRLEQRFSTTAYLSPTFGNRRLASVPGGPGGGVLPAQAGIEVAYQPPRLGLRNGRIFQVFGRVLANVEPNTLRLQTETVLGGVGVRYKPFKTQNGFLSAERLFKLGELSTSNWLLRGLYSWSCGLEIQPEKRVWNYTTFYADAAWFAQSPQRGALYGEAREGFTINLDDRLRLTPHLIADLRHENPGDEIGSYIEGGGGLSIRYTPRGSRYARSRTDFELLVHYRAGRFLKDPGAASVDLLFTGWLVTLICQF